MPEITLEKLETVGTQPPAEVSEEHPNAVEQIEEDANQAQMRLLELCPAVLKLKKILVPLDFSDTSEKALQYAVAFAKQFGSKITLLHVIEPLPYPGDLTYLPLGEVIPCEPAKARLREIAQKAIDPELLEQTLVRIGLPFEIITAVAQQEKADLIIITTNGRTGLKRVFLGSTAERVVRHAQCPVLTVREKEREFVTQRRRASEGGSGAPPLS